MKNTDQILKNTAHAHSWNIQYASVSMSLKLERMEADGILFNQSKQVPGKLIHLMGMMYLAWLEGRSVLKFDLIYCIRSTHMWFDGLKTNMFLRELELWIIIIRCMGPKNILIQYWMISVCKSSMINLFFFSKPIHFFDILRIRGPNPFPPKNHRE